MLQRCAPTHHPTMIQRLLSALALSACVACATSTTVVTPSETDAPAPQISHDVYFTFTSPTDESCDALVTACALLRELPGVVHLVAGRRDESQTGGANETLYHVGLHVEFADQAAYDGYLPHATHQALVSEFIPQMSSVIVYDTLIGE